MDEPTLATATPGHALPGVHRIVAKLPFDLPIHPFGVGHMLRLMRARRPDVVHVHTGAVSPFAWMGVRAAVRVGLPVVVTVHSMWDPLTRIVYRGLRLLFEWHRWGLVGTAVSEAAALRIRSVAGRRVPVHVVSNGLDLSGWRSSDAAEPVDAPRLSGPERPAEAEAVDPAGASEPGRSSDPARPGFPIPRGPSRYGPPISCGPVSRYGPAIPRGPAAPYGRSGAMSRCTSSPWGGWRHASSRSGCSSC